MTTTFKIENGDVVVNAANGQPLLLADGTKLKQDLAELLSIEAKEDNIGAGLEQIIDGSPRDVFSVRADVSRNIRAAVRRMQALQAKFQRNERPPTERLRDLSLLYVTNLQGSITSYVFRAEFSTSASSKVPVTGVLT
jgi:hypothetical protein